MSEKQELDLSVMPDDVQELRKVIIDFTDFHAAVMGGQFVGKASKVVDKLLEHIAEVHRQTLEQYNNHPWVIAERAQSEKIQVEQVK